MLYRKKTYFPRKATSGKTSVQYSVNCSLFRFCRDRCVQRWRFSESDNLMSYSLRTLSMITAAFNGSLVKAIFPSPDFNSRGSSSCNIKSFSICFTWKRNKQQIFLVRWDSFYFNCTWHYYTHVIFSKTQRVPSLLRSLIHKRDCIDLKKLTELSPEICQIDGSPLPEKIKYALQHYFPCNLPALNDILILWTPKFINDTLMEGFWWRCTNDVIILMPVPFTKKRADHSMKPCVINKACIDIKKKYSWFIKVASYLHCWAIGVSQINTCWQRDLWFVVCIWTRKRICLYQAYKPHICRG